MRKYDNDELMALLEDVKSDAVRAEVSGMFAATAAFMIKVRDKRRWLVGMIEASEKVVKGCSEGKYEDYSPEMVDVKMRQCRAEARFAAEMIPLIDEEAGLIERDFEVVVKAAKEKDEELLEEERDFMTAGKAAGMVKDLRELN